MTGPHSSDWNRQRLDEQPEAAPLGEESEPSRPPRWRVSATPEQLAAGDTTVPAVQLTLDAGREVEVYGLEPGEPLDRLLGTLRSLSKAPELEGLRQFLVVEELGEWLAPDGSPQAPIRALAPDGEGRMLIARSVLSSEVGIQQLFQDFVERERLARIGEACQVREQTTVLGEQLPEIDEETTDVDPAQRLYQGRPVISKDSAISGGVYLCTEVEQQPAIVVDHAKDHRLRRLYRKIREKVTEQPRSDVWSSLSGRFTRTGVEDPRRRILRKVRDMTSEHLPPWDPEQHEGRGVDEEVLAAIAQRGENVRKGQKIYLGEYLRISSADGVGGGDCTHRSLLAGHILERLTEEGILEGKISLERNMIPGLGVHAWIRFTDPGGEAWILDATREYLGPVEEAEDWIYLREEDIARLRNRPF